MYRKKAIKTLAAVIAGGFITMGFNGDVAEAATVNTQVSAQVQNSNPYGLVYRGAITQNVKGKVNIRPVEYEVEGIYEKREVVNSSYEQQAYEMGKNV